MAIPLHKITCDPKQSQELVNLGITAKAFMYHARELKGNGFVWETGIYKNPVVSETLLPAWTKQELEAMMGNRFDKPDFVPDRGKDEWEYAVYTISKMRTFRNGAHASADALIFLLKEKELFPDEVVERYNKLFA